MEPEEKSRPDYPPINEQAVENGYRSCRKLAKQHFQPVFWTISNLPAAEHGAVCALLMHLHRGLELASRGSSDALNQDQVAEFRDDLGDAIGGMCVSPELAALSDAHQRFNIPRQFVFEFIEGIDWLMRFPPPDSWEDLLAVASRIGGSIMAAACYVFQMNSAAGNHFAIRLGQALTVTWWLNTAGRDVRRSQQRLAIDDFEQSEMDPTALTGITAGQQLTWFARLYGHRIEQLLRDTAPLLDHLDYDGVRVAKALASVCFCAANNVRLHPEMLLKDGIVTAADLRRLNTQHFLGLEPALPFSVGHHPQQ